jgi:hypothetical protein
MTAPVTNDQNDQLRYAYQVYLKGVGGRDDKTIDAVACPRGVIRFQC